MKKKKIMIVLGILIVVVAVLMMVFLRQNVRSLKNTDVVNQENDQTKAMVSEEDASKTSEEKKWPKYYCESTGYVAKDEICVFGDGTQCSLWTFFTGKCGREKTLCERNGYKLENRRDNMGDWTSEYAVCVFEDNSECLEQHYLTGKCIKSQCKKWEMSKNGCLNE